MKLPDTFQMIVPNGRSPKIIYTCIKRPLGGYKLTWYSPRNELNKMRNYTESEVTGCVKKGIWKIITDLTNEDALNLLMEDSQ